MSVYLSPYLNYYNCYSTNCNPCNKKYTSCVTQCSPCVSACTPCGTPCVTSSYLAPCAQQCVEACPVPCPVPCTVVAYYTDIASSTAIISGGSAIPTGTTIPSGSTTIPANTVTVITGYTGIPTTNTGGVIPNNGFFTIPVSGKYAITATICFATVATTLTTDLREVYIYKVDATTSLVTKSANDSRVPIAGSNTCVNVSAYDNFNVGDRVFIAARQINGSSAIIDTVAGVGRLTITKVA